MMLVSVSLFASFAIDGVWILFTRLPPYIEALFHARPYQTARSGGAKSQRRAKAQRNCLKLIMKIPPPFPPGRVGDGLGRGWAFNHEQEVPSQFALSILLLLLLLLLLQ
jgi:hypothetical protein